jgi:nitrate/nitrite-specific signal transduction histidine kinase
MLTQLLVLVAQALIELHQQVQFLFERVQVAKHGRTIVFISLLSQSLTECFASILELAFAGLLQSAPLQGAEGRESFG